MTTASVTRRWIAPRSVRPGDRITGLRCNGEPDEFENFGPFTVHAVRKHQVLGLDPTWALHREPDHRIELTLYAEDRIRVERS